MLKNPDTFTNIRVFDYNPKIIRVYNDEINVSKKFTKNKLYFSILSPYKLTLGLKVSFFKGIDEAYKWKMAKKKDVFAD